MKITSVAVVLSALAARCGAAVARAMYDLDDVQAVKFVVSYYDSLDLLNLDTSEWTNLSHSEAMEQIVQFGKAIDAFGKNAETTAREPKWTATYKELMAATEALHDTQSADEWPRYLDQAQKIGNNFNGLMKIDPKTAIGITKVQLQDKLMKITTALGMIAIATNSSKDEWKDNQEAMNDLIRSFLPEAEYTAADYKTLRAIDQTITTTLYRKPDWKDIDDVDTLRTRANAFSSAVSLLDTLIEPTNRFQVEREYLVSVIDGLDEAITNDDRVSLRDAVDAFNSLWWSLDVQLAAIPKDRAYYKLWQIAGALQLLGDASGIREDADWATHLRQLEKDLVALYPTWMGEKLAETAVHPQKHAVKTKVHIKIRQYR